MNSIKNENAPAAGKKTAVSNQTGNFINCLISLNRLYSEVYDAINCVYGDSLVDEVIDCKYSKIHSQVEEAITSFLIDSLNNNLMKENNEI